ncbi:DUF3156 family protein [Pseudomonas paralactis]|uniref:Cytoplasmic protein n=1 Tax=Pseudomonas paralactis TaxID=1615673 RepID=A0A0R3APE0_9PSED|nr:DUF3156 family protein [Pseudomonas paralactis]KRP74776.1 hypothetical protein TX23_00870 [Pseudomonas paralactis]MBC3256809.1 DUF3156 family protein [Pseudomonas paralactis]
MTVITTLRQKLCELFSADRAPSGYRPGVTLARLRRDLGLATLDVNGLVFELVERTESQLLMHVVMTEFVLHVPTSTEGAGSFDVHHGGAIRRNGIRVRRRSGSQAMACELQARLLADNRLFEALMPLDFKRLRIDLKDGQWCVRLEHMGGSEVVNRMPAFRRYIAVSPEQRNHLLAALAGIKRALSTL